MEPRLPAQVHQIQLFDSAEGYGGGTSEERLRDVAEAKAPCGDEKRQRSMAIPGLWGVEI